MGLDGRSVGRGAAALVLLGLLACSTGCLNPQFVNSLSGNFYPVAPGGTGFVLARVVNDTDATVDFQLTADTGTVTPSTVTFRGLDPLSREEGTMFAWPILRLGLGNLDNPLEPSITATFADGLTIRVPFARAPLVGGTDFQRGDTVVFRLTADSRSPTYIRVAIGRINGAGQQGPFSRANTFQVAELLLLQSGALSLQEQQEQTEP